MSVLHRYWFPPWSITESRGKFNAMELTMLRGRNISDMGKFLRESKFCVQIFLIKCMLE